jgi:ribonuclease J
VREAEDLIEQMRRIAFDRLQICRVEGIRDWAAMKNWVRDDLRDFIYQTTKRSPVILPIFMEV